MTPPNCLFGLTLGVFKKLQYANEIFVTEEPVLSQEKRFSKSVTWRHGDAKQNKKNTSNADSRRGEVSHEESGGDTAGAWAPP